MAMSDDRITFWFGCNMLRHAEMIRLSIMLLERVGYDVNTAGGPAYCCGTAHDHQPHAASNMAGRTVVAVQRRRRKRTDAARSSPGARPATCTCPTSWRPATPRSSRSRTSPSCWPIAPIGSSPLFEGSSSAPRAAAPALGFATHVAVNDRVASVLSRIRGPRTDRRPRASRPHVQCARSRAGRAAGRGRRDLVGGHREPRRHALHHLPSLPSRTARA